VALGVEAEQNTYTLYASAQKCLPNTALPLLNFLF